MIIIPVLADTICTGTRTRASGTIGTGRELSGTVRTVRVRIYTHHVHVHVHCIYVLNFYMHIMLTCTSAARVHG